LALTAALPSFAQQSSTPAPQPATAPNAASAPSATPAETPPTPAASSATTATTQPPAGADKTGPSAETIKRAKGAGLHPETHHGQTMFCWEDSSIGTRFTTKKCTDENGLDAILVQREAEQQNLRQLKTGTSGH
jgi:hypothetical protein